MKHVVVTRLCQKWSDRELTDRYVAYSIDMFRRVCRPSVLNQTVQPDMHLVLCSPTLNTLQMEEIESIQGITVLPADPETSELTRLPLAQYIRERVMDITQHVITTNCDSDDALHRYWVEYVNYHAANNNRYERTLYGTSKALHYSDRGLCQIDPKFVHPCLSLSEWVTDGQLPLCCLVRGHAHVIDECNKLYKMDKYLPLMTCHYANICTRYFDKFRSPLNKPVDLLSTYGFNQKAFEDVNKAYYDEKWVDEEKSIRDKRRSQPPTIKPVI